MNLLCCCILSALTIVYAAVDVERTVQQVENILQHNSNLPRLTRDEIIQLLNDIRAEDAKSSASKERSTESYHSLSSESNEKRDITTESYVIDSENEVNQTPQEQKFDEYYDNEQKYKSFSVPESKQIPIELTTKSNEPSVMVVLPYTPRDGSSLQELFTRPPRVEVVLESQIKSDSNKKSENSKSKNSSNEKLKETFQANANLANKFQQEMPPELQNFLNAHGLSGKPGQDHFLLPLDGFKPLPPASVVDGNVQLPENILLTYDLLSANSESKFANENDTPNNAVLKPLYHDFPLDLENAPSESEPLVLPLDMPKSRKPKSASSTPTPNLEPIDYDSVRVIPLQKGPKPEDDDNDTANLENELNKRQAENTTSFDADTNTDTTEKAITTASLDNETKEAATVAPVDSSGADTDSGASVADLEDSFGGAAPSKPGDSELPPQRKNGFYWMLDWNSFLEVGDGDTKVNIRLEPKLGDPQMFLPVNVP